MTPKRTDLDARYRPQAGDSTACRQPNGTTSTCTVTRVDEDGVHVYALPADYTDVWTLSFWRAEGLPSASVTWTPGRTTNVISPWKGRGFTTDRPVRVYRCLAPHGGLYSVVQGGRVVGHADELTLEDVVLHVSRAGYARRLRLGHKIVYAYVQGTLGEGGAPCPDRVVLDGDVFRGTDNTPVYRAAYARLDVTGLHVG